MMYAREIIELMGAYPGRDFKMVEIVNYVTGDLGADLRRKQAIRKGAIRALHALSAAGCVMVRPSNARRGGSTWRPSRCQVPEAR